MHRLLFFALLLPHLASALTVNFHHGLYYVPGQGQYVETYLLFDGADMRYVSSGDEGFQATAEVTYIFEQDGKVVDFSKVLVNGPITKDTAKAISDFLNQQRFFLEAGTYDLTIRLRDVNNPIDTLSNRRQMIVPTAPNTPYFSDIFLADRLAPTTTPNIYSRNGQDIFPRVSGFYPPDVEKVTYYAELYNASESLGDNTPYLLVTDLVNLSNDEIIPAYHMIKRVTAREVEPVLRSINVKDLLTGDYLIRLEARDRNNELIANKSIAIKRFNIDPPLDSLSDDDISRTFVRSLRGDSLRNLTYCLRHRSSPQEEAFIDKNWKQGDEVELRRFFYGFWKDRNPIDPRLEWARYNQLVEHVEDEYGNTTNHGCSTDRGRIYLKYGKPNSITDVPNEPYAYPYEIWHYNQVPGKSNAKFVFYDPRHMEEYQVLHSNVPSEQKDYQWFDRLYQYFTGADANNASSTEYLNPTVTGQGEGVGGRALEYWNNPR